MPGGISSEENCPYPNTVVVNSFNLSKPFQPPSREDDDDGKEETKRYDDVHKKLIMTCHVIICGFDAGAADAASVNIRLNAVRHDTITQMKYLYFYYSTATVGSLATVVFYGSYAMQHCAFGTFHWIPKCTCGTCCYLSGNSHERTQV